LHVIQAIGLGIERDQRRRVEFAEPLVERTTLEDFFVVPELSGTGGAQGLARQ